MGRRTVRPMTNDVDFFAINADDVPRARNFYETVFGWGFEPWGPPGFYLIATAGMRRAITAAHYRSAASWYRARR